jgi:hypothetical protein
MTKGIEIRDLVIGSGEEAQFGKRVVLDLRMFLHRGEEVAVYPDPKVTIDLQGRPCIAGLCDGILGMRVGGRRTLTIAPHLAYGANGVPGRIPPNALLRCEVELLEVRELFAPSPDDLPPDRHVVIYHPGEAARNLPRWQFGLSEDGKCGAGLSFPIPGMTWRHARKKEFHANIEPAVAVAVLNDAETLPARFPKECLSADELWADSSEPANAITRDRQTDTLCITIDIWKKGRHNYYRVREDSPALKESELYRTVISLLRPYLTKDSAEQSAKRTTPHLPD